MKKSNISEEDEAQVLILNSTYLIKLFSNDFVKQSTRKGHIEVRKESANFAVIMRVERKKEAK